MERLQGLITAKEEWLYPDSPLGILEESLEIVTASNGKRGVQLLVGSEAQNVEIKVTGDVDYEVFEMVAIPVEYNTVSDEEQGGTFVELDFSKPQPLGSTRKAPFWVYDCLKPVTDTITAVEGRCASYITLQPKTEVTKLTVIPVELTIKKGETVQTVQIQMTVYPVAIPNETLQVTNWFHLDNMAKYHNVQYGSQEHFDMIRLYAKAMRRVRQTHFFISIDERCITDKENWAFDLSYLEPIVKIFFEEGLETMELGYIATRSPNHTGKDFNFVLDSSINLESKEGYLIMCNYLRAIKAFLDKNGWQDKVIFHISDEPDVHTSDADIIRERKRTYFMMANQLRKYIPGIKIIEAVGTAEFRGGIDILVPLSASYEKFKDDFDLLIGNGEEVWNYVCCSPAGKYLNRFLDFALLKNRLLFWSCSAYQLTGFLHWGFNMFLYDMNPFEATSCHNDTGLGTNFPCGDAFIVYPGEGMPWISMRLEAQRRGAEDYELLQQLKKQDASAYETIMGNVFTNHQTYLEDPTAFEAWYQKVLEALV